MTGTPIRDVTGVDRLAARERLGLPPDGRLLVIFGGSQAVRRLNDAVVGALPRLLDRTHVIHVTGPDGHSAAAAARAALPESLRERYRPEAFLGEGLLDALAAADLVVGRAGSSTLAEVAAFGLPLVVVPYPYAGAPQRANAAELVAAGAARVIDDDAFDAEALIGALTLLDDPSLHATMSAAARRLARPRAADAIAEILLALGERRSLPAPDDVARIAAGTGGSAGFPASTGTSA